MEIPAEILYKIAEFSDDYIKTLKGFGIEPREEDYKYIFKNVFKNILKDIEEIDVIEGSLTFAECMSFASSRRGHNSEKATDKLRYKLKLMNKKKRGSQI